MCNRIDNRDPGRSCKCFFSHSFSYFPSLLFSHFVRVRSPFRPLPFGVLCICSVFLISALIMYAHEMVTVIFVIDKLKKKRKEKKNHETEYQGDKRNRSDLLMKMKMEMKMEMKMKMRRENTEACVRK